MDKPRVTLNGTAVTAETTTGEHAAEAVILLADAGVALTDYDQTAALTLTVGESSWSGTICFDSAGLVKWTGFSGGNLAGTTTGTNTNGTLKFTAKAGNVGEIRHYLAGQPTNMKQTSGVGVVEFDMTVDKMPAYPQSAVLNNGVNYFVPGMNLGVIYSGKIGYTVGVSNLEELGLCLLIGSDDAAAPNYIMPLHKAFGEAFRIRMEYSFAEKRVMAYCDDIQIGQLYDLRGSGGYSSTAVGMLNFLLWIKDTGNCSLGDVDFTISDIRTGSLADGSIMDNLTLADILGDNLDAAAVTSDLTLPAVVTDPMLGSAAISWTSSDTAIIGHDGVLTGTMTGAVTMTAALVSDPTATKSFALTVTKTIVDAAITTETMTPDGIADELSWQAVAGGNGSDVAALWNNGSLWLKLETGTASAVGLTLGETHWDLTLGETISADGIEGAVKDGIAELKIDLADAGIQLANYGERYTFRIDGTGVPEMDTMIHFSGRELSDIDWGATTINNSGASPDSNGVVTVTYKTSPTYYCSPLNLPGLAGGYAKADGVYLTGNVQISAMTALGDGVLPRFTGFADSNDGVLFFMADCYDLTPKASDPTKTDTQTSCIAGKLYTQDGENLRLAAFTANGMVDLGSIGVKLGETFTLGFYWAANDTLTFLINGTPMEPLKNAATNQTNSGLDVFQFRTNYAGTTFSFGDTKLLADAVHTDVIHELTPEAVFAGVDPDRVTGDLPMGETVATRHLGDVAVRWESSDPALIGTDGTVHIPINSFASATVTLYLEGREEPLWSLELTVVDDAAAMDAVLATDGVTVDGILDELLWSSWIPIRAAADGLPNGSVGAAWTKGHIYIAAVSDNADSLTLTINGNTVIADLTDGTDSGPAGITAARNGNAVELDLPMEAVGAAPDDYNAVTALSVSFANENGTSASDLNKLCFSGKTVDTRTVSNASSGWSYGDGAYRFEHVNDTAAHYVYSVGNNLSLSETTWLSQDLYFAQLPVTDGSYVNGSSARGYYYYASRNCGDYSVTNSGDMFFVVLYNAGDGHLKANIMTNSATPNATLDLGVNVGEAFRLTTAWAMDGSLKLYVNGSYVGGSDGSCTFRLKGCGDNVLTFRYLGSGTEEKVSFEMKNLTAVQTSYTSIRNELTAANVLNRADLDRVLQDLPMDSTYEARFFEAIPISWSTSDASVIEADGTVHRGEAARTCQISLLYKGETLWTEDVTLAPAGDREAASSGRYMAAYTDAIVVDGTLRGETWHMANKLLTDDGLLVGEMGAAWNLNDLFIAVRNSGAEIDLTVNGKKIILSEVQTAVSGDYTEIAIPMDEIDVAVTGYDQELDVAVMVGAGKYEGTLILSGTDWWGAGNGQEPLPMLPKNVNSVTQAGGYPDENQGAKEITNGWHLFDRYDPEGANPSDIRTYILFMKTSPYEKFDDREGTTTVEFDFQALSLPVYDETALNTTNVAAFACYGLCWSLADAANSSRFSNVLAGGIYNSADGLQLVLRGNYTYVYPLGKQVGDQFRITMCWNVDNSLDVYIDGELFTSVDNLAQWISAVGDSSFVINMIRNKQQPQSEADNMEVYVTNIAFGSAYPENLLDTLSWDDIRGENMQAAEVTADLNLPHALMDEQLDRTYPLVWTSSEPSVIDPETGKVTRPETGAVTVTLTAAMDDGSSREFTVIVTGTTVENGNTLVVFGDTNPAAGIGVVSETVLFTLDENNNSVIEDMQTVQTINAVKLTDLDSYSRLNRESMTLWISSDNETYTQIADYKLLQQGRYWYLYDFEAVGRYVKVHYTHWDGADADFIASVNTIIDGWYDSSLVQPADAVTVMAPATTLRDQQAALADVSDSEFLRISLNGELLYHYVEDGVVYVRIPEPSASGTELTVWNGTELELSNKEACFEITYGTRETYRAAYGVRWLQTIPAGTYGELVVEKEMLIAASGNTIRSGYMQVSYDGGMTWSRLGTLTQEAIDAACKDNTREFGAGGWIFDDETGAIFFETHNSRSFDPNWVNSDTFNVIIGSYDLGETWELVDIIEPDTIDGSTYNYMLSYSDGIKVSSYDGAGPNVDFVFPTGAQYTTTGAMCCRAVYSADGGKTWQMSPYLLTYGEERGAEGGLSEAWILENEDGVLVLYSRCQFADIVNFAKAYSHDFGLTWTSYGTREEWEANRDTEGNRIVCTLSSVYATNTQALMYKYAQSSGVEVPLMIWGGNTTMGGASYFRTPMNVAVSYDGLETWRNIQNLFSETYLDIYTEEAIGVVTNHSVKKSGDDSLVMTFHRLRHGDDLWMTVSDFENWLYRTKGAYDSFESGNPFYEGWSARVGLPENSKAYASEGQQSLHIPGSSVVTRSIPYLQNGSIKLDVYVTADTAAAFALQPAFGNNPDAYTLTTFRVEGRKLLCGGTSMDLQEGWNTVEIDLALTEGAAVISVNGGSAQTMQLNLEAGDYVCCITVFSDTALYLDAFTVVSDLDAKIYTGEEEEVAEFYGANMKLGNDLSMNFYIEAAAVAEAAYAEVTFKGETTVIEKKDWVVDGGYYKIAFSGMAAKEMTEEMTIQLFDADDNAVSELYIDSVRAYAMRILVKEAATDADKTLMVDMLNYGAAAQSQFAYKTDDLANALLNDEQKAYATESVELTDARMTGENYYGTSLNLKTNIQMNVYFTNVTEDMTAFITYTNHNGETKNFEVPVVMTDSYGKVTVERMVVADAYQMLTIEVKDADGNVVASVVDSVESYCYRTMADQPLNEYLMKFAYSAWKSFED